jgi:plasmid stability protein
MAKYTESVYFRRMKNLTITLDEETARLARVRAAKRDMSVSRYIGEVLRRELRHDEDYEAAYRAWRARKPFPLKGSPQPYPKREELYDRPVLRRR